MADCRSLHLVRDALTVMLCAGLALAVHSPAKAAESWTLDDIYPDTASWQKEVTVVDSRLAEIATLRDQPIRNARQLAHLLSIVSDARGRVGKMAKVGLLQSIVDTTSKDAARRREESERKEAEVEGAVSFLDPLVRSLGEETLRRWLTTRPELAVHERRINRILRMSPYAWPKGAESFESELTRLPRTANDCYTELLASGLTWPLVPDGSGNPLTPRAYNTLRRSADTDLRRAASKVFLEHMSHYLDLFALALTRRIEGDLMIARRRNLSDSVDALLVLQDAMEPQSLSAYV